MAEVDRIIAEHVDEFVQWRDSRAVGPVIDAFRKRLDEIITAEVRPDLVREARIHWSVENNIYQLGHRGYVAVAGGARDCPYTYMTEWAAGRYGLPWEDAVKVTDGTSCGFEAPTRRYGEATADAAE